MHSRFHGTNSIQVLLTSFADPQTSGKQYSVEVHLDIPMAPCDNEDLSSRLADSGELADKLSLVRHVLATFHGPDEIKPSVFEGLM